MGLFQAAVLGLVQGLTEFMPISGSAHLIIVPWLLKWSDPGLAFDAALHLGTLAAVLCYFWRDWLDLARGFFSSILERRTGSERNRVMPWLLIAGTIPGGIAGFFLEKTIDAVYHEPNSPHARWALVAMALALAVLVLADELVRHRRGLDEIGLRGAILIGVAQTAALVPGVSCSGATITAGLLLGLNRETAARFSFLLPCPIVAGAGSLKVNGPPQARHALIQAGGVGRGVARCGHQRLPVHWLSAALPPDPDAYPVYLVPLRSGGPAPCGRIRAVSVFGRRAAGPFTPCRTPASATSPVPR